MKWLHHFGLLSVLMLLFALGCASSLMAAEAPVKKDTQIILSEMRLKKFTKELALTQDQQKKVQAIFDEENQEISKVHQDTTLSITDRRAKLQKFQQDTYAKMKPLLTPAQLEKFEKLLVRPARRKK